MTSEKSQLLTILSTEQYEIAQGDDQSNLVVAFGRLLFWAVLFSPMIIVMFYSAFYFVIMDLQAASYADSLCFVASPNNSDIIVLVLLLSKTIGNHNGLVKICFARASAIANRKIYGQIGIKFA